MEETNAGLFDTRVQRIRRLAAERQLTGILVSRQVNLSWLTGGSRSFIGLASDTGCFSLLVTSSEVHLIVNNIEADRIIDEEMAGLKTSLCSYSWFKEEERGRIIRGIVDGKACLTDSELDGEFASLRRILSDIEIARYRLTCLETASAVEDLCREAWPGMSELQAAGRISERLWGLGIEPVTMLVGSDDRLFKYRHPLPTPKKIEKYLMVAVCVRKHGLHVSCTRSAYFGRIPEEIANRHRAVAQVDAALIAGTQPGRSVREVFRTAMEVYRIQGFEDEWRFHHQGGLTGYAGREFKAEPESKEIVSQDQLYAWNPTIRGTKSEDSILTGRQTPEILTYTERYVYTEAEFGGTMLIRPAILERYGWQL